MGLIDYNLWDEITEIAQVRRLRVQPCRRRETPLDLLRNSRDPTPPRITLSRHGAARRLHSLHITSLARGASPPLDPLAERMLASSWYGASAPLTAPRFPRHVVRRVEERRQGWAGGLPPARSGVWTPPGEERAWNPPGGQRRTESTASAAPSLPTPRLPPLWIRASSPSDRWMGKSDGREKTKMSKAHGP